MSRKNFSNKSYNTNNRGGRLPRNEGISVNSLNASSGGPSSYYAMPVTTVGSGGTGQGSAPPSRQNSYQSGGFSRNYTPGGPVPYLNGPPMQEHYAASSGGAAGHPFVSAPPYRGVNKPGREGPAERRITPSSSSAYSSATESLGDGKLKEALEFADDGCKGEHLYLNEQVMHEIIHTWMGHIVDIDMFDGKRISAVLSALNEDGCLGLRHCAIYPALDDDAEARIVKKDLCMSYLSDVRMITISALTDMEVKRDMTTDAQIAARKEGEILSKSNEKVLEPYYMDDELPPLEDVDGECLSGEKEGDNWYHPEKMFNDNQERFQLPSTYDEKFYTTEIDRSHPDYVKNMQEATRLAREIEVDKQNKLMSGPTARPATFRRAASDDEDFDAANEASHESGVATTTSSKHLPSDTRAVRNDTSVAPDDDDEEARYAAVIRVSKPSASNAMPLVAASSGGPGGGGNPRRGGYGGPAPYARQHSGGNKSATGGSRYNAPPGSSMPPRGGSATSTIMPLISPAEFSTVKRNGAGGGNRIPSSASMHASPPARDKFSTPHQTMASESMVNDGGSAVADSSAKGVPAVVEASGEATTPSTESATEPQDRKGLNPDAVEFVPRWQMQQSVSTTFNTTPEETMVATQQGPELVPMAQGHMTAVAMDPSQQPPGGPMLLSSGMMPGQPAMNMHASLLAAQAAHQQQQQQQGQQSATHLMAAPMFGPGPGPRLIALNLQANAAGPGRQPLMYPAGPIGYQPGPGAGAQYMIATAPGQQPVPVLRPGVPMPQGAGAAYTLTQLAPPNQGPGGASLPLSASMSMSPPGSTMKVPPGGGTASWAPTQPPPPTSNSLMPHPPPGLMPQFQATFQQQPQPHGQVFTAAPQYMQPPPPGPPMRQRSIPSSHSSYNMASSTPGATPGAPPPVMLRSATSTLSSTSQGGQPVDHTQSQQAPSLMIMPSSGTAVSQAQVFLPALNMGMATAGNPLLQAQAPNLISHPQQPQQSHPHYQPASAPQPQMSQAQFIGMTQVAGPNATYFFTNLQGQGAPTALFQSAPQPGPMVMMDSQHGQPSMLVYPTQMTSGQGNLQPSHAPQQPPFPMSHAAMQPPQHQIQSQQPPPGASHPVVSAASMQPAHSSSFMPVSQMMPPSRTMY